MLAHPLALPVNGESPYKFIDATSLGATFTTDPVDISYLNNVALHLVCTTSAGSPNGTFDVQGAAKIDPDTGDWVSVTLPSTPTLSGSAANFLINLALIAFPYIRVVYTRSSGTGTANGWIFGKE